MLRFALVQALQVGALGLALWLARPAAVLAAALIGGAVAVLGTDSGWRWRNALLLTQAGCWLLAAGWALWGVMVGAG